ncbi:MAG: hypothetical protein WC001_00575 [Desulfurivibrionaceae bacterium]
MAKAGLGRYFFRRWAWGLVFAVVTIRFNAGMTSSHQTVTIQQCPRLREAGRRSVHLVREPDRSPQDGVLLDSYLPSTLRVPSGQARKYVVKKAGVDDIIKILLIWILDIQHETNFRC